MTAFVVWFAVAVLVLQVGIAATMEWLIRRLGRIVAKLTVSDKRCEQGGCQLLASTDAPDPRPETRPEPWTRWEA